MVVSIEKIAYESTLQLEQQIIEKLLYYWDIIMEISFKRPVKKRRNRIINKYIIREFCISSILSNVLMIVALYDNRRFRREINKKINDLKKTDTFSFKLVPMKIKQNKKTFKAIKFVLKEMV